jgi:hypothetical protein
LTLAAERPVESEVTPLSATLIPLEAEVERVATPPTIKDSPVESDVTPLNAVLIPVDAEAARI